MDVYRYIDSPDIRSYLQEIRYKPPTWCGSAAASP